MNCFLFTFQHNVTQIILKSCLQEAFLKAVRAGICLPVVFSLYFLRSEMKQSRLSVYLVALAVVLC